MICKYCAQRRVFCLFLALNCLLISYKTFRLEIQTFKLNVVLPTQQDSRHIPHKAICSKKKHNIKPRFCIRNVLFIFHTLFFAMVILFTLLFLTGAANPDGPGTLV